MVTIAIGHHSNDQSDIRNLAHLPGEPGLAPTVEAVVLLSSLQDTLTLVSTGVWPTRVLPVPTPPPLECRGADTVERGSPSLHPADTCPSVTARGRGAGVVKLAHWTGVVVGAGAVEGP